MINITNNYNQSSKFLGESQACGVFKVDSKNVLLLFWSYVFLWWAVRGLLYLDLFFLFLLNGYNFKISSSIALLSSKFWLIVGLSVTLMVLIRPLLEAFNGSS